MPITNTFALRIIVVLSSILLSAFPPAVVWGQEDSERPDKQSALSMGLSTASALAVALTNADLTATIQANGNFTLQTADGRDLVFPNPSTSYLSLKVDDRVYTTWNDTLTVAVGLSQSSKTSASITYRSPQGVTIVQTYDLRDKVLRVEQLIRNEDIQEHNVATRYLVDTQVGDNDGSPLYTSLTGVRTNETTLLNPTSRLVLAYDRLPTPSLLATVTLVRQPTRMVFAHWPRVTGFPDILPGMMPRYPFDYTTSPDVQFYTPGYIRSPQSDSCLLLYYEVGKLVSGAQESVSFAYGIEEASSEETNLHGSLENALLRLDQAVQRTAESDVSVIGDINADIVDTTKASVALAAFDFFFDLGINFISANIVASAIQDYKAVSAALSVFDTVGFGADLGTGLAQILENVPDSASKPEIKQAFTFHYRQQQKFAGMTGVAAVMAQNHQQIVQAVEDLPEFIPASPQIVSLIDLLHRQASAIESSHPDTGYNEVVVPVADPERMQSRGIPVGAIYKHRVAVDALLPLVDTTNKIGTTIDWMEYATIGGAVIVKGVSIFAIPVTIGGSTIPLVVSEATIWTTAITAETVLQTAEAINTTASLSPRGSIIYELVKSNAQVVQEITALDQIVDLTVKYTYSQMQSRPLLATLGTEFGASTVDIVGLSAPDVVLPLGAGAGAGIGTVRVRNAGALPLIISTYGTVHALLQGVPPAVVGLVASHADAKLNPGEYGDLQFTYSVRRSVDVGDGGYILSLYVTATAPDGSTLLTGPVTAYFTAGTDSQLAAIRPEQVIYYDSKTLVPGQVITEAVSAPPQGGLVQVLLVTPPEVEADLHLLDAQNRHVGVDYETGEVENGIPGARYSGTSSEAESILVQAPPEATYQIEVVGLDVRGNNEYALSSRVQSASAAALAAPPQLALTTIETATQWTLPVREYGLAHAINNLQVDADLVAWNGEVSEPPQVLVISAPKNVGPGERIVIAGALITKAPGTGVFRITIYGDDSSSNTPVSVESELIVYARSAHEVYLPALSR
jgi:hypothetical protein